MYSLKMINRNGHCIEQKNRSITALKDFAAYYPLSVYFAWIYNIDKDEMVYQNNYTDKWQKCDNESFIPYY